MVVGGGMTKKTQAILVVDSCADSRSALVGELANAGYAVEEASSPVQCLDYADRDFPAVIILDPYMTGVDGFSLITQIRERYSAAIMPILITSADCNPQTIARCLTMGANDYIAKPFDSTVFMARVYTQIQLGQTRRQIVEQQERLNHVLAVQRVLGNMTSEGLVVTDSEGHIIYRNDVVSGLCAGKNPGFVTDLFSLMFPKEVIGALELLRQHHGEEGIFEQEFHWGSPYDKHMIVRSCPVVVGEGERLRNNEAQLLLQHVHAHLVLRVGDAQPRVLERVPARPEARLDPAAAHLVDRGDGLREGPGDAEGHRRDERAEPDARGLPGEARERRPAVGRSAVVRAGEARVVVGAEERLEALLLRGLGHREEIGVAHPLLGLDHDREAHRASLGAGPRHSFRLTEPFRQG